MMKLLFKLALFLPLIALIIFIEYLGNTAAFFNKKEKVIATALTAGNNITFSEDFDDRIMKRLMIESEENKKDVVVFGSSRSLRIDKSLFPDKSFFNSSVTGSRIEDYMGIYQIYKNKNKQPGTIILGLSPWLVEKQDSSFRWLAYNTEFKQMVKDFASPNMWTSLWVFGEKYKNVFSLPYLQFIFHKVLVSNTVSYHVISGTTTRDFFPVMHSDGSVSESLKVRSANPENVEDEIKNSSNNCPTELYGQLSQEKDFLFKSFVQEMKKDKVAIIFWLAPFHPLIYNTFLDTDSCRWSLEAEKYFRNVAKENDIQVVGSYDPSVYNLGPGDFYDSIHPRRRAIEAIFKKDGLMK